MFFVVQAKTKVAVYPYLGTSEGNTLMTNRDKERLLNFCFLAGGSILVIIHFGLVGGLGLIFLTMFLGLRDIR